MSQYFKKGKGWRYDFTLKGIRQTEAWFKTKKEAKKAEAEKRKEVLERIELPVMEAQTDMTFLDLINKWLDHVQVYKSNEYYRINRIMARHWVKLWGDTSCSKVLPEMIEKRLIERRKVSAYCANKELRHLRVIFNFGKKKFNLPSNPTGGIEFFPMTKRIKYVPSSDDIENALSVADPEVKEYLMAIKDTMARVSEINRLIWDDVDLHNKYLVLYTRKKRGGHLTPRKVPLTQRLYEILSNRYKVRKKRYPWVFCNTYVDWKMGKEVTTNFKYRSTILRTLCKKAGVRRFSFHALRHSGASILDNMNVPLGTIQKILGHENRTTTEIYLHSIGGSEMEAMSIFELATQNSHTDSHMKPKPNKKGSQFLC
jgi:integrase